MTLSTLREPWQSSPPPAIAALEREAWQDLVAMADPAALAAAGLTVQRVAGSIALRCRLGGPLTNRAYGASPEPARLRELRAHYDEAEVPLYFVEIDAPPGRAEHAAAGAGLVRYRRGQIYSARGLSTLGIPSPALDVGPATPAEIDRAARIYCAGFDMDRALAPVFASLLDAPRWHWVVARDHGEPVGVGLLYVHDELAYLMGGATAPAFRGMGAQAACIAARIAIAADRGCRVISVRTGEPVDGDLQHSQHNLDRAGFVPIGRCDSYAPPGIVWTHGRRSVAS